MRLPATKRFALPEVAVVFLWGVLAGAVLLSLVGCEASSPLEQPTQPGQDLALAIVWSGVFGQEGPPPDIDLRTGSRLDCPDGEHDAFVGSDGRCKWGQALPNWEWRVEVAVKEEGMALSRTTFSHELGHVASFLATGDLDVTHSGEFFLGGRVIQADEALRAVGR